MSIIFKLKSLLNHYKQFKEEERKFKNSNIKYYGFWSLSKSEDCWFTQFIEHRDINPKGKKINFFSVYRNPRTSFFTGFPKIFFTGENIFNPDFTLYSHHQKYYIKDYSLSLGFNYLEHKKYFRFPLWILYVIPANADFATIKNLIDNYNDPEYRISNRKKNFCANISRHDINGIRKKIIHITNWVQAVSCAGIFMNNTKELQEKYNDDKIEYLKTFKFNICPENSDNDGYVTEKLFESFSSGSIPIYWGSNNNPEPSIINPDSILFYDPENPQILLDKVYELWNDEKAYKEFCQIKPFTENAAEIIWDWLNTLESKIKTIV